MPNLHASLSLTILGVGSTMGAGIYVLVGTVAREYTGPALTVSFLISGVAAALSALCYAELSCRFPSAGSAYHYSYICIGERYKCKIHLVSCYLVPQASTSIVMKELWLLTHHILLYSLVDKLWPVLLGWLVGAWSLSIQLGDQQWHVAYLRIW